MFSINYSRNFIDFKYNKIEINSKIIMTAKKILREKLRKLISKIDSK